MEINYEFLSKLPNSKPKHINVWSDTWRYYNGQIYKLEDYGEVQQIIQNNNVIRHPLTCSQCQFQTFDVEEIRKHCIKHIKEEDKRRQREKEEQEKKKLLEDKNPDLPEYIFKKEKKEKEKQPYEDSKFKCDECEIGFSTKKQFSAHNRWNHKKEAVK